MPGCSVRGLVSILVTLFGLFQVNLLPERTQACSPKENFAETDSCLQLEFNLSEPELFF